MTIVEFVRVYDTAQQYQIELCYRNAKKLNCRCAFIVKHVGEWENHVLGEWVAFSTVLPFAAPGHSSFYDGGCWPRMVMWYAMQEFESMAVQKPVDGGHGWVLEEINVLPEECRGAAEAGLG